MASAQLVVTSGPDRGRSFPLTAGQTIQVGRSQATATKLTDPTVSRVHCEIEWDGERAVLINISTSGTYVNGQSVAQQEIKPGDILRLGATEFRFYASAATEASTLAPAPKPAAGPEALAALV